MRPPNHRLLRRAPTAIAIGLAGLTMIVLTAPHTTPEQPPPTTPVTVHGPISWDVLNQGIRDQGRWYAAAASRPVRVRLRPTQTRSRHRGYATVEECIAAVENGGDYGRSTNPSHFGRYQYDRQTWVAHGGDPNTWGTASPEEQDRVFANGTATYGTGAWTPYDGCG